MTIKVNLLILDTDSYMVWFGKICHFSLLLEDVDEGLRCMSNQQHRVFHVFLRRKPSCQ